MTPPTPLRAAGWNAAVAAQWPPGTHLQPARVVRTDRAGVRVWTEWDDDLPATTSTSALDVVAGDWVGIDPRTSRIELVLERHSAFVRRAARGSRRPQVLAANMDRVLVVEPADPGVNPRRLERWLVLAHQSGAEPLVVVNKIDLVEDPQVALRVAQNSAGGVGVLATSCRTGVGIDELRDALSPRETLALLGASGVGKSSLVNQLAGDRVRTTGEVRRGDHKGRHTTTAAQLVEVDGLLVIDTPGVRALGLWGDGSGVDLAFPEIVEAAGGCRFGDCSHGAEPGCAVTLAAGKGRISPERVEHYRSLRAELPPR